MRSIATDVAWSVCLSVGHKRQLCKNGWTDRDAVWVWILWRRPRNHVLRGPGSPTGIETFRGSYLCISRHARGRYCHTYSLGGRSDAAFGYNAVGATCQYTVYRYGLLLQTSDVAWSSVCWAQRWAVQKRMNRSRWCWCRLEYTQTTERRWWWSFRSVPLRALWADDMWRAGLLSTVK